QYADLMDDTSPVYIQAGNIQLSSVDSLIHATVSGTPLNNDQTELTLALASLYKKRRLVTQTFDALEAHQKADTKYTDKLRMTSDSLDKLMEPIKFAFIKSHPDSYVSVITLNGLVNHTDLTRVADAYSALSHASKTTALGKAMGVTIASAKRSQIGVMAANFKLNTSAGKKVKLASFKGKYVLVDFWASWCSPCRAENPNVVAAYEKYRSKNFSVISISIDGREDRKTWLAAIKKDKLPWVQAVDNYGPVQKVKDLYGVTTIPANVLIDPTGKIVAKNIRGQELHDTLEKMLK
ncbi:MAG: TlpA family protein disulfide reductase, partial [Sphingobacteriales bacterium]